MFKVSPFKLKMFSVCPLQYKYTYLDDLARQYKKPKAYLTMGAHVHNALHDFYDKTKPENRSWDVLEKLLRTRWRENRDGFKDLEDEKKWGMKALQMLKMYYHKNDVKKNPLMLEDYYDTEISENVKILGRIDRVDQEDAGLHVIDYKTGKFDKEDVSDIQLIIYSLIMANNVKLPVYKASYLFLATNEWYSIEVSEEKYQESIDIVMQEIEKIKQEKEFLPTINKNCKHCDFLEICPKLEEIKKQNEQQNSN